MVVEEKTCEFCGKKFSGSYTATLCKDCRFKKGTIWTLHMTEDVEDEWLWTKEVKK